MGKHTCLISIIAVALTAPASVVADSLTTDVPPIDAPKVSKGLKRCFNPLEPTAPLPQRPGEHVQYSLELIGISVGTVNVETGRQGTFRGQPVTEYRAWGEPASAIGALLTFEARVASLVPVTSSTPVQSMTSYRFRSQAVDETQRRGAGTTIVSKGDINGKRSTKDYAFGGAAYDYLTGFQMFRRLPAHAKGCAIIYSHQRVYTVWVYPEGTEQIELDSGKKLTLERYKIKYGSNNTKKVRKVRVWAMPGADHLPYKIEGLTKFSPVAILTAYKPGR